MAIFLPKRLRKWIFLCNFAPQSLSAYESDTHIGGCDEFYGGDEKLSVNGRILSANDAGFVRQYLQ